MNKFSGCILVLTFIFASCDVDDECDFTKINSAPVITNNSDEYIIMKENQTYAFTVNANDEDGTSRGVPGMSRKDSGSVPRGPGEVPETFSEIQQTPPLEDV